MTVVLPEYGHKRRPSLVGMVLRRHHDKHLVRAYTRRSHKIAQAGLRQMRREIAAAELPAGYMARTTVRLGQANELLAAVTGTITAVVAIRTALRELCENKTDVVKAVIVIDDAKPGSDESDDENIVRSTN